MFAVKGWSVSADKLKPEVASAPATGSSEPKKSKKRKRSAAHTENVTANNVVDLWERVIEHKGSQNQSERAKAQPKDKEVTEDTEDTQPHAGNAESQSQDKKAKKDKKRQKLNSGDVPSEKKAEPQVIASEGQEGQEPELAGSKDEKPSKKAKKEKKDKKDKSSKSQENDDAPEVKDTTKATKPSTKAAAPVVPAPPKLTPLQAAMREKLISARFRHLNETLYTRPSADAFQLFEDSPEMFTEYHEGFRRQVDVWPANPVDSFLAEIRERARLRDSNRRQKPAPGAGAAEAMPLPRNRNTAVCTIADLGCGDAGLASGMQAEKKKLKLEVLSFDLHSPHPLVTKADIANLPLASGSVDVAIFCLALMGTNWVDFVEEAYRVLRWKGELWVAEIKSRFGSGMKKGGGGGGAVVEHSVGNRRKPGAAAGGKKANKAKDDAADEKALLVEVDGVDDTRQQTDVSAFVEVLNKRGFMLQGQDQGHGAQAVDLSNKMFVKMRFVKCAPAVKGKCVPKEKEVEERNKAAGKMPMVKKPKFIDDADKDINEAAVLKPCVYKIR